LNSDETGFLCSLCSMRFRFSRIQIRIRKSFLIYLILAGFLSSAADVLAVIAALVVHECGHILAGCFIGEQLHSFELTPFGGILYYDSGRISAKGFRGVITAAAGPAANYLFLVILGFRPVYSLLGTTMTRRFITANASMFLLNLLPVLPLDGGRIVLSVGFYFVNVSGLINVLGALGCFTGAAIAALSLYGLAVHGILNVSLIIIGGYIVVCARASCSALICENAYSVIQERTFAADSVRKTHLFSVARDTRIINLLPAISRVPSAMFLIGDESPSRFITERALLLTLLETPGATIDDTLDSIDPEAEYSRN